MEAKKNGKEHKIHHSNYLTHTMCCQQNRQLNGKGLVNNNALHHQGRGAHNPANGLALRNAIFLTSQRFINFNISLHNIVPIIILINNGSTFI